MAFNRTRILSVCLMMAGLLSFTACSSKPSAGVTDAGSDWANFTWSIKIDRWEISDELNATQSVMQYNGVATNIQYEEKPSAGHTFLLMRLTIEKQSAGPSTFKWDDLYIVDGAGNKTYRLPNDTFLVNYNLLRIKSTNLVIGRNEGYLCFEIPAASATGDLILIYESAEGVIRIPLTQ